MWISDDELIDYTMNEIIDCNIARARCRFGAVSVEEYELIAGCTDEDEFVNFLYPDEHVERKSWTN